MRWFVSLPSTFPPTMTCFCPSYVFGRRDSTFSYSRGTLLLPLSLTVPPSLTFLFLAQQSTPVILPQDGNFHHVHAKGHYPKFLIKNSKTETAVSDTDHPSFLMYFFCRFFYGTASAGVVQELQPFITLILSGTIYAWGPFFLVGLYRGMQVMLDQIQPFTIFFIAFGLQCFQSNIFNNNIFTNTGNNNLNLLNSTYFTKSSLHWFKTSFWKNLCLQKILKCVTVQTPISYDLYLTSKIT